MIFVFLHTQKTFSITNKHTFYILKRYERRVETERKRGSAREQVKWVKQKQKEYQRNCLKIFSQQIRRDKRQQRNKQSRQTKISMRYMCKYVCICMYVYVYVCGLWNRY